MIKEEVMFIVLISALTFVAGLCLSLADGREGIQALEIGVAVGAIAAGICVIVVALSEK